MGCSGPLTPEDVATARGDPVYRGSLKPIAQRGGIRKLTEIAWLVPGRLSEPFPAWDFSCSGKQDFSVAYDKCGVRRLTVNLYDEWSSRHFGFRFPNPPSSLISLTRPCLTHIRYISPPISAATHSIRQFHNSTQIGGDPASKALLKSSEVDIFTSPNRSVQETHESLGVGCMVPSVGNTW